MLRKTCLVIAATVLLVSVPACRSDNNGNGRDEARIKELQGMRLLSERHFAETPGLRARPYHTVVLNLESDTAHDGDTGGVGYDMVPYEVLSPGLYSFCMEDDDAEAHYALLRDSSGRELARWTAGDASCDPVFLVAGNYDLEVHHGREGQPDDAPDLVFLAPQAIRYAGSTSAAAPGFVRSATRLRSASVVVVQNVSVTRATRVLDLITTQPNEGWILRMAGPPTSAVTSTDPLLEVVDGNTARLSAPYAGTFDPNRSILYPRCFEYPSCAEGSPVQFSIGNPAPLTGAGWLATGSSRYPVVRGPGKTDYYGYALGRENRPIDFDLEPTVREKGFFLHNYGDPYSAVASQGSSQLWLFSQSDATSGVTLFPLEFYLSNRTGTIQGQALPTLFAGEAAFFDQCYDSNNGFPAGTRYLTAARGEDLDVIWSQVYPTAAGIRTVVTTSESQVLLFPHLGLQGDVVVVTAPPGATAALATCSSSSALHDGTTKSFDLQPNNNTMTIQNYENKVLVRSNTCTGCNLQGFSGYARDLSGTDFSRSNLSHANLAYAVLAYANFRDADLTGASLSYANLAGADITGARLDSIDFMTTNGLFNTQVETSLTTGQAVRPPTFSGARIDGACFGRISLFNKTFCVRTSDIDNHWEQFDLYGANIANWSLDTMNLQNVSWSGVTVTGKKPAFNNVIISGNLQGASLIGAQLTRADMSGANLAGANLSNASIDTASTFSFLSAASFAGAVFANGAHLENVDLTQADLSNASLTGAHFCGAEISRAVMFGTDLAGAYLEHEAVNANCTKGVAAILNGSNMQNARLNSAHMDDVVMNYVTWFGADATGAGATMRRVHLSHADLPGLNLQDVQLQEAIMTDTVLVSTPTCCSI